jgi:hypothetical protein
MKALFYVVLIAASILVTFLGLGPAFFADGTLRERLLTIAVVLILYVILGCIALWYQKRHKAK